MPEMLCGGRFDSGHSALQNFSHFPQVAEARIKRVKCSANTHVILPCSLALSSPPFVLLSVGKAGIKMSDYEDEMDVDAPVAEEGPIFSSDNTNSKGKRSAANLPVEAEDSLPWVEKYRPENLEDVSGHQDILATINKFVDSNRLPHLLLYGPPGTGKTSTVLALARRIYGAKNMRQMVLELNASDDRGIDVVREQIKTFASRKASSRVKRIHY